MDNNEMNVTEVALDMSEDVNEALEKVDEIGFSKGEKITAAVIAVLGIGALSYKFVKKGVKSIPKIREQRAIKLLEKKGYTIAMPESENNESADDDNDESYQDED